MAQRLSFAENEAALATLRTLRRDLDAVTASQQREAPSEVDERFLVPGFDPNDVEQNEEEWKEDKAVGASATFAEGAAASRESFEERNAGP
ncbi:hypothetical protein LTR17_022546 [Elasticomyces elasticus]|nr:hypothetical protein LTR17_022546 [Elasticomyces elasticus]